QAGPFIATPKPRAKVSASKTQGVVAPMIVNTPSDAAASSIQDWVMRRSRRRSTTSASAPARSASRKTGRVVAAWTSATMLGEGAREVISHAAPTFCIQVPTLEATEAIQRARKTLWRNGLQGDLLPC